MRETGTRTTTGTTGTKVSAAMLQVYLKGINYPADKDKIIETARNNNCPDNVMQYFRQLPDRTYERSNHVEEEFGRIKESQR